MSIATLLGGACFVALVYAAFAHRNAVNELKALGQDVAEGTRPVLRDYDPPLPWKVAEAMGSRLPTALVVSRHDSLRAHRGGLRPRSARLCLLGDHRSRSLTTA